MLLWHSLVFSKHYDLGRTNYYLGRIVSESGTESWRRIQHAQKYIGFSEKRKRKKQFTQTNPPTSNKLQSAIPARFSEAALLDSK